MTSHLLIRKPLELWSFRFWPLVVCYLWISTLVASSAVGYEGWTFFLTASVALVTALIHFCFPYHTVVRYVALGANLVAMLSRAVDYVVQGAPWRIALVAGALWITIATSKLVIFFLSATLVETKLARDEVKEKTLSG